MPDTKIITKSEMPAAARIIKSGGIVVFPTETVYGLGACAFNSGAVEKIFKAKGRPSDNPLIVHIANMEHVYEIAEDISEKAIMLMQQFWAGPLTIVLKKKACVPYCVTAGLDTVGVRIPNHPIALDFLKLCNVPVAAPSANLSGKPSPTTLRHAIDDMDGRADAIIDGGDCTVGVESTVISMVSDTPVILRAGGITLSQIKKVIGNTEMADKHKFGTPPSPGMKYRHYAPDTPVKIVKNIPDGAKGILNLGLNPKLAAKNLFRELRRLDKENHKEIYTLDVPDNDEWRAVRDRLHKAAGGKEYDLSGQ